MPKYILLLTFLFITCTATYAQKAPLKPFARNLFETNPRAVSSQLSQRVTRTYAQALRTQDYAKRVTFNQYTMEYASKKLQKKLPAQYAHLMYPDVHELLTTDKQLSRYFLAQNNRETIRKVKLESKNQSWMHFLIPQLQQIQIEHSHPSFEDMHWLSEQVPLDTDYLLLGEQHLFEPIQESFTVLLPFLQKRFKGRPIVLLTEALPMECVQTELPDGIPLSYTAPLTYVQFLQTAEQLGIVVNGLEPPAYYMLKNDVVTSSKISSTMWSMPEGIRIRNKAWLEEINRLRKANSNALFIIHGGMAHFDYTNMHSVGKVLKNKGNTYLVSFLPGYTAKDINSTELSYLQRKYYWFHPNNFQETDFLPVSTFDFATQGKFPQRIVQFKEEQLVKVPTSLRTGFDIQIKIPVEN